MQVTIYDIAKMANVSTSTVSRVVNNKDNVNPKTRSKILKLLAEYNYVPNEAARGLVMQSSHMIGILITDIRTTQHTDGIYYIEKELGAHGYSCLIHNTGVDENGWVSYIQSLSQHKIQALILMGSIYQSEIMKNAIQLYLPSIPVVICNGYFNAPNVYGIVSDELNGTLDCVALLSEKGRKHPAFLMNQSTPSNEQKKAGYLNGVTRYYPDIEPITVESGNSIDQIHFATERMMKEHPDIDSIIYSEDMLAAVGLRTLADMGKKVPEDVAVIGINNSSYAQLSIPTLTSLDNMLYDVSMTAARNILALLSGQRVSKKMLICTEIVERHSV
ncbi:MAG: LacI family DNA-binding transcriptional regulator [Clostridia bacterium]|nr:LacI family DNA-binding transcriptional regulator [Clostridia bacterium]